MPSAKWRDFGNQTYALTGGTNIGVILDAGRVLIVDTGLDGDSVKKALRRVATMEAEVTAILITHGHADHFGGAGWLAQQTGAPVYAPAIEGVFAEHPILEPLFLNGGADPIAELRGKFTLAAQSAGTINPLAPGRVEVGNVTIEVVPLPGHAPGQVGIGFPGDGGTLFCGDAVFPQETLDRHPILFCADLDAWLTTLAGMPTLDYRWFVPGHGDPVHEIAQLAEATAARLHEIRDRVLAALATPKEPYDVLRSVASHYGERFAAPQFFLLSLTTILAALTSLQRAGEATVTMSNNRMLWQRA